MPAEKHIYSVSELNANVRLTLEDAFGQIWLEGEMSNFSRPASGHWYFHLKDNHAQIRCAFFKNHNRLLRFLPANSQQLLVKGYVSLYEARGDYQFIVSHMQLAGEGELQKAYEDIKRRLHAAGLFAQQHKIKPPAIPRQIGLVTSPSGAVLHDALHILKRRFPLAPIIIYPTSVQGADAAPQIINAIKTAAQRNECDVLLLIRGGGSLEDLWPFNDEQLARAIYDCTIPIISGVGHEVDVTIADFVADQRAPTPSAAAEIITPDQANLLASLAHSKNRMYKHIDHTLRAVSQQLDWRLKHLQQAHPGKKLAAQRRQLQSLYKDMRHAARAALDQRRALHARLSERLQYRSPAHRLAQYREKLIASGKLLRQNIRNTFTAARQRLHNNAHALNTVNPVATLARGYSISRRQKTGEVVKHSRQLAIGELVQTQLADGAFVAKVKSIDDEVSTSPEITHQSTPPESI